MNKVEELINKDKQFDTTLGLHMCTHMPHIGADIHMQTCMHVHAHTTHKAAGMKMEEKKQVRKLSLTVTHI